MKTSTKRIVPVAASEVRGEMLYIQYLDDGWRTEKVIPRDYSLETNEQAQRIANLEGLDILLVDDVYYLF